MQHEGTAGNASWYVVHTRPKQEFRALEQLRNQGYECCLPTIQLEKAQRGKLASCTEPLFARYLFIRLDDRTSHWSPIRSTRGVSKMVAFGNRFATVRDDVVDALQKAPLAMQPMFVPGERVAITYGPLAGLEGIFQMKDGEARAMVLIEWMSQPQKLVLAIGTLQKAA
ncbi:transcription/translation regulatory transformer protein RfaH [Oxalobacteraceae bacterium R-40]|uniref:Transcription/translation regulatory transformer protein RfaH n=1 Tax=Keguizhuia sedimenti TaxID=3064264 RepID=A0ABU1BM45_9BURK|nr:transcription/translation regulatory transformer protein RfaH [Oxalobacteraceae bacterium R-40]